MFVLGIDPGLAVTGYGVIRIDVGGPAVPAVAAAGVIRTDALAAVQDRLAELYRDVTSLLGEYRPQSVAMERLFVNRNLQTASSVARASGVILLAAAEQGAAVSEYTPSQVKIAVSG
ncbi:MAG TPA: crossover junction endodeoxyribonuclease RuvC, partial [Acidimicrobiia bacterium]